MNRETYRRKRKNQKLITATKNLVKAINEFEGISRDIVASIFVERDNRITDRTEENPNGIKTSVSHLEMKFENKYKYLDDLEYKRYDLGFDKLR